MSLILKSRSSRLERMDIESMSAQTIADILGALETINRLLGGVRATLGHFQNWSKKWKPAERIRIVDWGTGGADLPRALVLWGRARGFQLEITGVDHHAGIAEYARKRCEGFPEIKIVAADATSFAGGSYDYAISSLTLHHLSDEQIISLLQSSDRIASRGMVMNDLIRSARAWAWIWSLSRLGGAHPIVQDDGPLSVLRAFCRDELTHYAEQSGLTYVHVYTHFGYRQTLAGEKS